MRTSVSLAGAVLGISLFSLLSNANDIEPGKEFYTAIYVPRPIVLDGDLSEWSGIPVLSDPKFAVPKFSGTNAAPNYVLFEPYAGGTWTGPDDHTSAVQIAYDDENVYFGFVVTDDYHENAARSAWNGDSVQLMIANADRTAEVARYNYALGGVEGDENLNDPANIVTADRHELGPECATAADGTCKTEAVIKRDKVTHKTIYEIKLPKASLGLTTLKGGPSFGLGMAINDGDAGPGQAGQKGWGGLGAHALVFGKHPSETALMTLAKGNDIEPGKEYYTALRITNAVTLDGDLSEWSGVPVLADPKFAVPKFSGTNDAPNYVLFEPYAGGTWTGPDDHTSAVQVAYDADNVYFGFVVTDDYHENAARSAWNGDSVQLMIANADRTAEVARYNYALGGIETDANLNDPANIVTANRHELGPECATAVDGTCQTDAVVRRDATNKKTFYEIKLPAASLGLTPPLDVGIKFGLGMAINDGDSGSGQAGQKGWGGLGAHALVFGKHPSETAQVTLGSTVVGGDLLFLSSVSPTYNSFSFRATDNRASIVDPASAKLTIDGQAVQLTASPKVVDATDFMYHPANPFPPNSDHAYVIEVRDTAGAKATMQGTFKTDNYALDKLHSYFAQIRSGAVLTPDKGGHSGQAGDTALDFGSGSVVTAGQIPDAGFLNSPASNNAMSVSVWVKKHDNAANSTAFWMESLGTVNNRGFVVYMPDPSVGDEVVNFDIAGDLDGDTRLGQYANAAPGYTGPDWWTNWHHWVFTYDGKNVTTPNKQIWVDGQLLAEGFGFTAIPTDFTRIWLGAGGGDGIGQGGAVLNLHGQLDDFAIYGSALTQAQVQQLFSGTSPTAVSGTSNPLAYWDFNAAAVPVERPALTIGRSGSAITISWPASATSFRLQSAAAAAGPYSNVTGVTGNSYTVNNPDGTSYYRLSQ